MAKSTLTPQELRQLADVIESLPAEFIHGYVAVGEEACSEVEVGYDEAGDLALIGLYSYRR